MNYLNLANFGNNKWWSYLIGIFAIVSVSQFLGYIPLELYFETVDTSKFTEIDFYNYVNNWDFESLGLDKNIALVALISSFGLAFIALFIVQKYLHKRSFLSLINTSKKIRWNRILFGIAVWGSLMFAELFFDMLVNTDNYSFQFDLKKFIPLFFIAIFLLPIQTSFEELFFRAYLLQAIALLTKYPIIPMIITSLLFALAHMGNPEVQAFGVPLMFIYYFSFAFGLAMITVWDKGIEIALGVHAINNTFGAITITYSDAVLQTDALWSVAINHIGWLDILLYICFFCFLVYAYYFWFIKRASGHVIRS